MKLVERRLRRLRERPAKQSTPAPQPDTPLGWPPGHFYSPIPSLTEVRSRENKIFDRQLRELPGIALNTKGQLELLSELAVYFPDFPFAEEPKPGLRFKYTNPNFGFGEALILMSWLRHFRPANIVEIGSGYSSCAMLDTMELFLDPKPSIVLVDPHPELVQNLIFPTDHPKVKILRCQVQELEPSWFSFLSSGDLLFIDSSHVSKVGSDVNYLLFSILPVLAQGVMIHFHDIPYPFEYPLEWVYEGRSWNEAYILRAFLQYNAEFEIRFWNSFALQAATGAGLRFPPFGPHSGSSLWLEKRPRHECNNAVT